MYRTNTCNDLNESFVGKEVVLSGWVHRRRDHGGVVFIDLRDRYGLTQVVSDPNNFQEVHTQMTDVRSEYVIRIVGKVQLRPEGHENKDLHTGKIEVVVSELQVLNAAKTTPFEIDQDKEVNEELRLTYRYLDLRRERMKKNVVMRHQVIKYIRDYFDKENFLEIETPILIKGTPEGSREYVVPSRVHAGNFYVLPQSPQQLKQLLMVAGMDRYFQIARCFRDEDQRGDRQPEFTQLDIEMSFVDIDDIMQINEKLMIELVEKFVPHKKFMTKPFPVLTYQEAMDDYGSDKPDIRFEMKLKDVSSLVEGVDFNVFKSVLEGGGCIKALKIKGGAAFTRKDIEDFTDIAKIYGAKGLAYIVKDEEGLKSPIVKFFTDEKIEEILNFCEVETGDIVFFSADRYTVACESLGNVRLAAAKKLNLIDEDLFAFCWVKDFPMFEKDPENGSLAAVHHPFTSPKDLEGFLSKPDEAIAKAYDLVLNGVEVGGGSIRIHEERIQKRVFDILGVSDEDAERRFGHMLKAFQFGAPPHGGIAWGLDRLIMIFAGEPNIREVIVFPKDQKAKDLMLGAPSMVPDEQLEELSIKVDLKD